MSRFTKKGEKEVPELNTMSLPDLIFSLLFFFMIVTTAREVTLKVQLRLPKATELDDPEDRRRHKDGYRNRSQAEVA